MTLIGREAQQVKAGIDKLKPQIRVAFDSVRKQRFLEKYAECGMLALSATAVGVHFSTIHYHLNVDEEFKKAYEQTKAEFIEKNIVIPTVMRASKGVQKAVYGGRFKDEIVGYETVYSDSLMARCLTAWVNDFKSKDAIAQEGKQGGVLAIPPAPMTLEEWNLKYGPGAKSE